MNHLLNNYTEYLFVSCNLIKAIFYIYIYIYISYNTNQLIQLLLLSHHFK